MGIGFFLGGISAATWIMIGVSAFMMLINFAIASTAASRVRKPNAQESRGLTVNTCDSQVALPLVYGRRRVGINRVYTGCRGDNRKYAYYIGNLSEGEIEGIVQVDGVDQIFLNSKLYTEFTIPAHSDEDGNYYPAKPLVQYEFFNGTPDQPLCASLSYYLPDWDSANRYTAYIMVRLEWDPNYFQSWPELVVLIDGLKIYNPDTTETEYSNNPALCARDFLTRSSRRGGLGIAEERIDDDSVIAAAAYCTPKGWTCNLGLNENSASAMDNLKDILSTFRGTVIRTGSSFRIQYRDLNYETPVMDIGENDIVEAGGKSTLRVTQPSIFQTPNAVMMRYFNEDKIFSADEYVKSDAAAIAADGDYREKEISVPGITVTANVIKMANYYLERLRINKTAGFTMGTRGMALEPEDVIRVTHSRPGWEDKMLRVTQPTVMQSGEVGVALEEESEIFYDDVYNPQAHTYHDTLLPDPQEAVHSVRNVTHTEEVYNFRGRSFTRWKIDFDPPAKELYPWWAGADIYIRLGADGDWKFMTNVTSDYVLDPVEEGQHYYCCIVSVSIWGAKQQFSEGYVTSKTIAGLTDIPADLTGMTALAHGDNVTIFADELTASDIAGYEVRLGAWDGGILIGFNETPNIRLAGVRPGTHTFYMKAKDNAGKYSANAANAQVTVYYPSGYTDKNTWLWDFTSAPAGDFDNTEYCVSGGDALKCSHTDSVLEGKWTSPVKDLGSVKTVRIWGDFLISLSGSSSTWAAKLAPGKDWAEVLTTGKRWYELLSPVMAGILRAKLLWGDTDDDLDKSTTKLEILAPEIRGQYVQVEITIIDPDVASNLVLSELNMKAAYWS